MESLPSTEYPITVSLQVFKNSSSSCLSFCVYVRERLRSVQSYLPCTVYHSTYYCVHHYAHLFKCIFLFARIPETFLSYYDFPSLCKGDIARACLIIITSNYVVHWFPLGLTIVSMHAINYWHLHLDYQCSLCH